MHFKTMMLAATATLMLGTAATPAHAAFPIYADPGTANPQVYTFTAASTGDLVAYFTGLRAAFTNILGLSLNGGPGQLSTINSQISPAGASFNFGPVSAGDTLAFYIDVNAGEFTWFSTPSLNADGANHVFSAAYGGGDFGIPAGTYVAFEDLSASGTDYNYNDIGFVFANTRTEVTAAVPEPATWMLMIAGFGLVGAAMRRRGERLQSVSARA